MNSHEAAAPTNLEHTSLLDRLSARMDLGTLSTDLTALLYFSRRIVPLAAALMSAAFWAIPGAGSPMAAGRADPQSAPPPAEAAFHLDRAVVGFKHKDYWEALRELRQIPLASVSPKSRADILRFEGKLLLAMAEPTQALAKIKEAAQQAPGNTSDLIQQAWAELLSGDLNNARNSIRTARHQSPNNPELRTIAALIEREAVFPRPEVPMFQDWHLKGQGLECCPCKVPCPCRSNAPPTQGHCETAAAFRIDQGHYGEVRLDGFVYVTLNGVMDRLGSSVTLFVDRSASDAQVVALERIYQAFNPLQPFVFLVVERAPISFMHLRERPTYEVEIPGRIHLKVQRQLDAQGRPLMRTAAIDYFSNIIEYAENLADEVWDEDGRLRWDFSHRQANLRFIDLKARDYQSGMMLDQFADRSGFFNSKHLELIRALNLPMLSSYPGPNSENTRRLTDAQ